MTAWAISKRQLPSPGMVYQLLAVLGYGLAHGEGRQASKSAGHGLGAAVPAAAI